MNAKQAYVPFNPTEAKVNRILHALRHGVLLSSKKDIPHWLGKEHADNSTDLIACQNGLLDVRTRELKPHSPYFFNVNALPFEYDPNAPAYPKRWMRFLRQLWPGDGHKQERLTLQEMFGLMLTPDTSFQKIFLIIGPKRSGKGTIGRVLKRLLGKHNVHNPLMASLGGEFGLWPLIDKRAAIITDARLGQRADAQVIAERLLSISGEDDISANRKNLPYWTGRLGVRFLIMTNRPPRISDNSGALVSRYVVLTLRKSFIDKEDRALTNKLCRDLPGILNWALIGLDRLLERGKFKIPEASRDMIQGLEEAASPVNPFIKDWCSPGPDEKVDEEVNVKVLYSAWCAWCEQQGDKKPGSANQFGVNLREVVPGVTAYGRAKDRKYRGVGLNAEGLEQYDLFITRKAKEQYRGGIDRDPE